MKVTSLYAFIGKIIVRDFFQVCTVVVRTSFLSKIVRDFKLVCVDFLLSRGIKSSLREEMVFRIIKSE